MWFQKPPLGTPLDFENPLNDNTMMHLAMNEGMGDVVRDLSGYGNHGTLGGFAFPRTVASGWNPGQTGRGLKFDGTDDFVRVSSPTNLPLGSSDRSISALVFVNNYTGVNSIIRYGTTSSNLECHLATTQTDGYLTLGFYANDHASTTQVPIGEWSLATATFSGTTSLLYLNGNLISTKTNHTVPNTANTDLGIGSIYAGGSWLMNGSIDQPRIVAGAWTPKQCMDYAMNPWQVYLDEDDY